MAENLNIVIAGQIRDGAALLTQVDALAGLDHNVRVLLSTWDEEVECHAPLIDALLKKGVEVLSHPPLTADAWGNPDRQATLIGQGLDAFDDDEVVVKLRPDFIITAQHVVGYHGAVTGWNGERLPSLVSALRGPIVVPWWNPQIAFRCGDEVFSGIVGDLKLLNRVDAEASLVCPHVGRFVSPFNHLPSWNGFRRLVYEALIRSAAARTEEASAYAERHGIIVPRQRNRLWPVSFYPLLRKLARTPLAQILLADFHFLLSRVFDVYNPTPSSDCFISRMGGSWLNHGYTEASRMSDPLRPEFFGISYHNEAPQVAERISSGGRYPYYTDRWLSITADPSQLLSVPAIDWAETRVLVRRAFWDETMRVLSGRVSNRIRGRLLGS